MASVFIGVAFLLLAPGFINYGLMSGYRGWVRYTSLLMFVGLPALTLIYVCFRQQAFAELAARTQSFDFHEDTEGAVMLLLAAPAALSGGVSSLAAILVLCLRKQKPRAG